MKNPLFILSLLLLSQLFPACNTQQEPIVGLWKATYPFQDREVVIYQLFEEEGGMYYILEARPQMGEPLAVFAKGEWFLKNEQSLWMDWKTGNIDLAELPRNATVEKHRNRSDSLLIEHDNRMQWFEKQEGVDIVHFKELFEKGGQKSGDVKALKYITETKAEPKLQNEASPIRASELSKVVSELASQMVQVKGGIFEMGCTEADRKHTPEGLCREDTPAHSVRVADFKIGKYEVTQQQWYMVMGDWPSKHSKCEKCPVENISWEDIQRFIEKINTVESLDFRLPTEAEWEYAARGGIKSKHHPFSGSDDYLEVANVSGFGGSGGKYHKSQGVGNLKPNELGLYDMSGNVEEWCSDWYDKDYYRHSPTNNPTGPTSGDKRVARGGSFYNSAWSAYVFSRIVEEEANRFTGFRLAAN